METSKVAGDQSLLSNGKNMAQARCFGDVLVNLSDNGEIGFYICDILDETGSGFAFVLE